MNFFSIFKSRTPIRVSGLEDLPEYDKYIKCTSASHSPPLMLAIPYGKQYRHICQSCGCETVVRAPQLRIKP